jgi:PBP1b-binding outer membrane lipoprotein LpoB
MKPVHLKSPVTYLAIFLLISGCATAPVDTLKKAIEKRKAEQCQCDEQPSPVTIIFVED